MLSEVKSDEEKEIEMSNGEQAISGLEIINKKIADFDLSDATHTQNNAVARKLGEITQ